MMGPYFFLQEIDRLKTKQANRLAISERKTNFIGGAYHGMKLNHANTRGNFRRRLGFHSVVFRDE